MPSSSNTIGLAEAERICAVREITFSASPFHLRDAGLLGWVRFVVFPGFAVRSVALRRGRDGSLYLAYPRDRSAHKVQDYVFYPTTEPLRLAIEVQVLDGLRRLAPGTPI